MNRNSLLTAGAALVIVGAAAVGGYVIDHRGSQSVELATGYEPPHSVTVPPPAAVKSAAKPSTVTTSTTTASTTPTPKPAAPAAPLREAVADNALVAVSGTVTDKKGGTLTLKEASGPVRVVMREDLPRPREMATTVRATDKIGIGSQVTIYGKLRTNDPSMPKLYADAVYDPATKTLYQLNGDRPAEELTSADITARYTPVRSVQTAKVTTTRVMTQR